MGGKPRTARAPFHVNPNPSVDEPTLFAPKILLYYKKTEKDNKALAKQLEQNSAHIRELQEQATEQHALKERLAEHERLMTELAARQADTEREVLNQKSWIKDQGKQLDTKIESLDLRARCA